MANKREFRRLYEKAHAAGLAAGENAIPQPMVVSEAHVLTGEPKANGQKWFVSEGVCGFAWVRIKPATTSFARWLKAEGLARRDSYHGGLALNVFQFNQSYERKIAYAHAFADVLKEAGITAYADGRLD